MEKNPISDIMETSMSRIRDLVDVNTVVGDPIQTPDGITIIPISKVSFGFGSGGSDYGQSAQKFGGGGGAGVRIDPVAFLIVKDGITRMMPVAVPAVATVDRILELVPEVMDRVDNFIGKKKAEKEIF